MADYSIPSNSMRGDFLDPILPWKIMTVEINP